MRCLISSTLMSHDSMRTSRSARKMTLHTEIEEYSGEYRRAEILNAFFPRGSRVIIIFSESIHHPISNLASHEYSNYRLLVVNLRRN